MSLGISPSQEGSCRWDKKKKKHRQPFPRRQAEVSAKRSSNTIIRRQIAEDRVLGVTIDQQVDNSVEMEQLLM